MQRQPASSQTPADGVVDDETGAGGNTIPDGAHISGTPVPSMDRFDDERSRRLKSDESYESLFWCNPKLSALETLWHQRNESWEKELCFLKERSKKASDREKSIQEEVTD